MRVQGGLTALVSSANGLSCPSRALLAAWQDVTSLGHPPTDINSGALPQWGRGKWHGIVSLCMQWGPGISWHGFTIMCCALAGSWQAR